MDVVHEVQTQEAVLQIFDQVHRPSDQSFETERAVSDANRFNPLRLQVFWSIQFRKGFCFCPLFFVHFIDSNRYVCAECVRRTCNDVSSVFVNVASVTVCPEQVKLNGNNKNNTNRIKCDAILNDFYALVNRPIDHVDVSMSKWQKKKEKKRTQRNKRQQRHTKNTF